MFKTERLTYRITNEKDIDALHACLDTQEMADSISFIMHPFPRAGAEKWAAKARDSFAAKQEWLFSVLLDGVYIGSVNLHKTGEDEAETGYWLGAEYRGQGFAAEMCRGIIKFGFQNLGLRRIFATTSLSNTASQKVLEKGGFKKAGRIEVKTSDGLMRPSFLFEIYNET